MTSLVKIDNFVGLFDPENHRTRILRNIGNCFPNDTAQHPRRSDFSEIPLWYPQTSHRTNYFQIVSYYLAHT
jgi:hypothetical protein